MLRIEQVNIFDDEDIGHDDLVAIFAYLQIEIERKPTRHLLNIWKQSNQTQAAIYTANQVIVDILLNIGKE